jgi:DNA-binding response OmpR family regulator
MKTRTDDVPSVLLVEDEPDLRDAVVNFLRLDGIDVVSVGSLHEALTSLKQQQFDVIILDLGLPDGDGLDLLQQHKNFKETGVIITSARVAQEQRSNGIRCGADAYFVKPFDLEELCLQVRNLTRRVRKQHSGYWRLDEVQWSLVTPMGLAVRLTQSEIRFLKPLMRAAGSPVDRQELVSSLGHKSDYYDARRMEIMVRRLRKKIDQISSESLPLKTVYGYGFAFTGSATLHSEPD